MLFLGLKQFMEAWVIPVNKGLSKGSSKLFFVQQLESYTNAALKIC